MNSPNFANADRCAIFFLELLITIKTFMKQSLIFLLFLFLSLNGISQRPDLRNDLEKMGLSKKVKCVREISYSKGSAANQKQENIIDSSFRNDLSCFLVDGKIDRLTSFS